jgi:uncharacterized caspase-like protein
LRLTLGTIALFLVGISSAAFDVGANRQPGPPTRTLYVLAIGLSTYSNPEPPKPQLAYARPSARAFANRLASAGEGIFDRVETTVLVDREATKAAIQGAFTQVATVARPNDSFVFFYAGDTWKPRSPPPDQDDPTPWLYLVPYDAPSSPVRDEDRIEVNEIYKRVTAIQARNQLLILDGESFDFVTLLVTRITADEKLLGESRRNIAALTAKPLDQPGALTALLLRGIGGAADGPRSRDGTITADELRTFVEGEVRERRIDWYLEGNDFPMARSGAAVADRDTSPPRIEIVDPKPGFEADAAQSSIVLRGKATDAGTVRHVLVNDRNVHVSANGEFTAPIELAEGTNTVRIESADAAGNIGRASVTIARRGTTVGRGVGVGVADPSAAPARVGRDYALLIATNSYEDWSPLANPIPDALAIGEDLRQTFGFEVQVVQNPTQREFWSTLNAYARRTYADDDQLFIFIAGHGTQDRTLGEGFLVARDSKAEDKDKERLSYIDYSRLRDYVNRVPSKHILLMLDACFGGSFVGRRPSASRGNADYGAASRDELIRRRLRYRTRLYVTSGGEVYVADGDPGKHSPFAYRLLEGLRSADSKNGVVTYAQLMSYLERARMEPRTGDFGDHEPGGDFLFIAKK